MAAVLTKQARDRRSGFLRNENPKWKNIMSGKGITEKAVAYLRTSSATIVGEDMLSAWNVRRTRVSVSDPVGGGCAWATLIAPTLTVLPALPVRPAREQRLQSNPQHAPLPRPSPPPRPARLGESGRLWRWRRGAIGAARARH